MIKTKKFKNSSAAVSWLNKNDVKLITMSLEDDKQVVVYREQGDMAVGRREAVLSAIERGIDLPVSERKKTNWPKPILEDPIVPLSRVVNSVRNLKDFKGLTHQELTNLVRHILPQIQYTCIDSEAASARLGVKIAIIQAA